LLHQVLVFDEEEEEEEELLLFPDFASFFPFFFTTEWNRNTEGRIAVDFGFVKFHQSLLNITVRMTNLCRKFIGNIFMVFYQTTQQKITTSLSIIEKHGQSFVVRIGGRLR